MKKGPTSKSPVKRKVKGPMKSPKPGDARLRERLGKAFFDKSKPGNKPLPKIEGLYSLPERASNHDDVSPERQKENEAHIPKGQPGDGDRL